MKSSNSIEPLAYSPDDACRALSIGKTHLYSLIKAGRLETRKIGRRTLIPVSSVRALIEGEAA
ncbi:MAG: helix-turn-helix domain-containing protein [Novosphingobium sp.]